MLAKQIVVSKSHSFENHLGQRKSKPNSLSNTIFVVVVPFGLGLKYSNDVFLTADQTTLLFHCFFRVGHFVYMLA